MARLLFWTGLTVLLMTAPRDAFSQGFNGGMKSLGMKDTARIHRKLPAVFVMPGTDVSVKVTATAAGANALPGTMTQLVETTLQHYDNRLVTDDAKPQVLISCVITGYIPPRIENLTHPGTPAGKNIFTGKPQAAQPPQPYKKVTGALTVSYRALDVKNKRTLDAAVLETKVNAEYEENSNNSTSKLPGSWKLPFPKRNAAAADKSSQEDTSEPNTPEEVNQRLLKAIASDIARRAVNTDDTIEVLLARGKLDPEAKLAQAGLWPRMLEQLESMPPFDRQEDEAYRLYDLGVAYEAMGYGAPDPKQGFKFFEEAAVNYGKALDANASEKYFREPQNRVQTALLITKTLKDRTGAAVQTTATEDAEASTKKAQYEESAGKPVVPATKPETSADPDVLTNDGLIDLKKSGMDDENLISNIKDAKKVDFDLTLAGQKYLMRSGISNTVLSAMRQRSKTTVAQKSSSGAAGKTSKPTTHEQ